MFCLLLTTCVKKRGSAYQRAKRRERLGEEDEMVILDKGRGSVGSSVRTGGENAQVQVQAQGHVAGGYYGGGTMPGPQYLLNMHPGVPVHKW